jgi:hypothetical protein
MPRIHDKKAIESRFMRRRQFLAGVGGAALCLPPLLSMMSRLAIADTVGRVKRVICIPTSYGIAWSMFFPGTPSSARTQQATPDLPIWTTPLTGSASPYTLPFTTDPSGTAVIGAPFQPLLSKMNLYAGLDYVSREKYQISEGLIGHTNGPLGANGGTYGLPSSSNSGGRVLPFGQSLDNVIAKCPAFYRSTPAVPVLRMASTEHVTGYSYSRTHVNTSPEEATYEHFYLGDTPIFNKLFSNLPSTSPSSTSTTGPKQLALTDAFLQDYKALKNNPRISAADQRILDQYVSGIGDLQSRIKANQIAAVSCSSQSLTTLKGQLQSVADISPYLYGFPVPQAGVKSCLAMLRNYNEIIKNAFLCDLTRVVVLANEVTQDAPIGAGTFQDQLHCHNAQLDGPLHAWFTNNVVAHLASLLDATPDPMNPGTSLLDNSVLLFTNEHAGGNAEHSGRSLPVMTIGSAGGALKTGYMFDCSQHAQSGAGRPYAQLLISIMKAVGLQPSDYAVGGDGNPNGFGDYNGADPNYQAFASTHNSPLPFVNV